MYISIVGLNSVPIKIFSVPSEYPPDRKFPMYLFGLDAITQYSSTISNFDDKIQLRITNQRYEY